MYEFIYLNAVTHLERCEITHYRQNKYIVIEFTEKEFNWIYIVLLFTDGNFAPRKTPLVVFKTLLYIKIIVTE